MVKHTSVFVEEFLDELVTPLVVAPAPIPLACRPCPFRCSAAALRNVFIRRGIARELPPRSLRERLIPSPRLFTEVHLHEFALYCGLLDLGWASGGRPGIGGGG